MTQKIIWTVLPNGVRVYKDENQNEKKMMKLSVFVSPRFDFADESEIGELKKTVFDNWAEKVSKMKFKVQINGNEGIDAEKVKISQNDLVLNSHLWKSIFPKDTLIEAFDLPKYHENRFMSYPVNDIVKFVKKTYTKVAEEMLEELPKAFDMRGIIGDYFDLGNINKIKYIDKYINSLFAYKRDEDGKTEKVLNFIDDTYIKSKSTYLSDDKESTKNAAKFLLAKRFYKRLEVELLSTEKRKEIRDEISKIRPKTNSFYDLIALVGNYPEILRKLGLVIDLEIPCVLDGNLRVNLQVDDSFLKEATHITPITNIKCECDNNLFVLQSGYSVPEIENGQLCLGSDSPYHLVEIDADGAALKSINTASSLQRVAEGKDPYENNMTYSIPDTGSLPTLKANGISLIKHNRAYKSVEHLKDMYKIKDNFGGGKGLFAEDLLRGYRVDVGVVNGRKISWYSLSKREGTYLTYKKDSNDDTKESVDIKIHAVDEGYVQTTTASSQTLDEDDKVFYVHENIFNWDGWSLVAPRPGKIISEDETTSETNETQNDDEVKGLGFLMPLKAKFSVQQGTLPKLRFGQRYKIRVRTVDIAGNSLSLDFEEKGLCKSITTETIQYSRFEPVASPPIMLSALPTEGESLEHMVIRSNYDASTNDYLEVLDKYNTYKDFNTRHIVPPKTSQLMVETHGVIDDYIQRDYEESYNISKQEGKTLFDIKGVEKVTVDGHATNRDDQSILYSGETIEVPYLPDVFAKGVVFIGLPGTDGSYKIDFTVPSAVVSRTEWPNNKHSFSIKIEEALVRREDTNSCDNKTSKQPKWIADKRILIVYLPKGEMAKVKYSCFMDEVDTGQMGITKWLKTDKKDYKKFASNATRGLNWLLTPYRELTLVHAVQQPLCEPVIKKLNELENKKTIGQTFAELKGKFEFNAKSMEKVEVLASWSEMTDFVTSDKPEKKEFKGTVFEETIEYGKKNTFCFPESCEGDFEKRLKKEYKHEFSDTKFRLVEYKLKATSRFREYFPVEMLKDEAVDFDRIGQSYDGIKVEIETDSETDYAAPIKFNTDNSEIKSVIPILSSARPAAPKIADIIPTFKWDEPEWKPKLDRRTHKKYFHITKKRLGGGIRIYLERPWFSSGDGEMLGVVLVHRDRTGFLKYEADKIKPYVSQWGLDPLYDSSDLSEKYLFLNELPSLNTLPFKSFDHTEKELSLEELKAVDGVYNMIKKVELHNGGSLTSWEAEEENMSSVDIVGYGVKFDEDKKLWYADIVMDSDQAYSPFVRLALARYQPHSIVDAHLSRVVLTDFIQLMPDRTLSVSYLGTQDKGVGFDISVKGITSFTHKEKINEVFASFEKQIPNMGDSYMGWQKIKTLELEKGENSWKNRLHILPLEENVNYRIVVNEYEIFKKDASNKAVMGEKRLVYTDAVEFDKKDLEK